MNRVLSAARQAARIWILTSIFLGAGWLFYSVFAQNEFFPWWSFLLVTCCSAVGSLPAFLVVGFTIGWLKEQRTERSAKISRLILVCLIITLLYGLAGGLLSPGWLVAGHGTMGYMLQVLIITAILFTCVIIAIGFNYYRILYFFTDTDQLLLNQSEKMETSQIPPTPWDARPSSSSNKILIKGIITGVLILVMMIPTVFISNLVSERQARQKEVTSEVSGKWASAQTLTGPYLYIPYKTYTKDKDGKVFETLDHIWLLPDNLAVTGRVDHEIRLRSIYKVLLYRANLQSNGNFILQVPKDVDTNAVQWSDIKVCYGLSDFKGIEERLAIKFNGMEYELSPGLPSNEIDGKGLSSPVNLTAAEIGKPLSFDIKLKLKGSEQLHFVPLSGNSSFSLTSKWPNPSFDGNNLPAERNVNDSGFNATWAFNKANLPFGTILKDFKFDQNSIAFGVTMLQPADQYAKTSRSVKYAILFIGLTFALFFIVELTQKLPVHPVQYVLIGLGLVIFYTLLLSISEFVPFDGAYLIAASATILLITFYAKSHFNSWRSAGIFGGVLSVLYGFIFILIQLEDTALLVGSIGLFIILALVMYASRKINWYGASVPVSGNTE